MSAVRVADVVEFVAGSADDLVVPLVDSAGASVADLSSWSGRCEVRHAPGAPLLVEWRTGGPNALVLAGSSARLVVSTALAEESLTWGWRLGWFDLVLTAPASLGSVPNRPYRGVLRVVPGITAP